MASMGLPGDNVSTWIESEYCASVAATLLARIEYFELLEDAMAPPGQLASALNAWRRSAYKTQALGGLVGSPGSAPDRLNQSAQIT